MYLLECDVRTVRRYMLGARTVSKSTTMGVLFRADSTDEKPPSTKHAFFELLTENPSFDIVAYSRRVDEFEAKYVHTRINKIA